MLYKIEKKVTDQFVNAWGDLADDFVIKDMATELLQKISEQIRLEKEETDYPHIITFKTELHVFTKEEFEEMVDALKGIQSNYDYDTADHVEKIAKILGLTK